MKPVLYIVIPCYNEEKVLPVTADLFVKKLDSLIGADLVAEDSRIMFVNDGSKDETGEIIHSLCENNNKVTAISLSRNFGHQYALLGGLMEAKDRADITISIDCDGQDDIDAMDDMVLAYLDGADIVYGVRNDRSSDSAFKRGTAQSFYRLMNKLGGNVIYNHADYRLLSKRVLEALSEYKEVNVFLRGMIPLVGFKSTCVYYERKERIAGESHYPLKKMISFAFEGITSLSIRPIRMITGLGSCVCVLGLVGIIWAVVRMLSGNTAWGWASTVCIILFLGGIQLVSIGVIGEYIGKIYLETKNRPRYIIEKKENL